MILNRFSGCFIICLGLLLYFFIIPYDTEVVDYGRVRPQTVPSAMAWILIVAGAILAIEPSGETNFDPRGAARAGLFLAIVAAGVYSISYVGFIFVSPVLALVIMLLMGERRFLWLALGAFGTPSVIWIVVAVLLGRPLP
jgi:putative tricarboxylic transport membrane protein